MPDLLYEKRNGIAYITFNRPERRNAISPQAMVLLAEAWLDFQADDSLRVAILTGAGNEAFCSGADLGRLIPLFSGARPPEDEWDRKLLENRRLRDIALLRRFDLYKPVISAVNGWALAGGTEILLATDIRLAVPHARLGLTEVRWALVPSGGSLVRLARQIPYCKAMEILLTGEPIPAEEAYRIGLINRIVPPERLMEEAEAVARRIAENGPLAVRKAKEAVLRTSGVPLEEAFKIENEIGREVFASEDAREGPRAFMEKRKPVYKGR